MCVGATGRRDNLTEVACPALSIPMPSWPETPSCLSHLSPFTNSQPPPQDPLLLEQDLRESTVVLENLANLKQKQFKNKPSIGCE